MVSARLSCKICPSNGFSLVELLVVVGLLALLSSFAVAAMKDMSSSKGVEAAAFEAKALIEFARSEAMVRQTPVWIAFRNATNDGNLEAQAAVFGSIDGTLNSSGTNLATLSRAVRLRGVGMSHFSALLPATQSLAVVSAPPNELLDNPGGIIATNIPSKSFENRWTMTFTPRGEVLLDGAPATAAGFDPHVGFGFVPARGNAIESPQKQDVGILVEGSTGTARILRF